jgi:glutamyl-tRNA reductase
MHIITIGINHKKAEINEREKFYLTKEKIKYALLELHKTNFIKGVVILSTCNRMEIYSHITCDSETGENFIKEFIKNFFICSTNEIEKYFYVFKDTFVIKHLFEVASGINSQIVGETEILGQVKEAFRIAKEINVVDKLLEKIFSKSISTGKIVRDKTKISTGHISIASIAIKKCENFFGSIKDKKIIIIGAGNIAFLLSKYLKEKNIQGIFVANRTFDKAKTLADFCGGVAIRFNTFPKKLKDADIIISSTSSPHIILKKEHIEDIMKNRKKPLLILDLAVPRDVDSSVKNITDVHMYDLDSFKSIVEENYKKRKNEIKKVKKIITTELNYFKYQGNHIF